VNLQLSLGDSMKRSLYLVLAFVVYLIGTAVAHADEVRTGKVPITNPYNGAGEYVSYELGAHYEGGGLYGLPTKFVLPGKVEIPVGPGKYVGCEFNQVVDNVSTNRPATASGACYFVKPYQVSVVSTIEAERISVSADRMRCANYKLILKFHPQDENGNWLPPVVAEHEVAHMICTAPPVHGH
jgi:hypothetical protein